MARASYHGTTTRITNKSRAYPNGSFDVVASMTAIHNIPGAGRAAAIAEAWRVTRPGRQIVIFDIRHARTHAAQLGEAGATDLRIKAPILLWGPLGWRFSATKPVRLGPATATPAAPG